AYDMPGRKIDGMNVLEVRQVTREVVAWVRQGNGPYFLEAMTYRFKGHSMADPSDYRKKSEEEQWRQRDPILRFRAYLLEHEHVQGKELDSIDEEMEREMDAAVQFADESPEPELHTLFDDIYADQVG
ncbi:MAG: pyruvate dehydrogenase (acetyl-transferring) E1 component subunit alpha, partial [Chloroflexi bacterium]|nr:pyruvate dehydrogenase (acetyl-transferring) E1 component subunit alpha [Chloroflexota bacterium]